MTGLSRLRLVLLVLGFAVIFPVQPSTSGATNDNGTGMSSENLDKMFQPFYTTKLDGLGMGLSISRSIIEAHSGYLWAANNHDRGATFFFTVPVGSGQCTRRMET
jgi:two-component system, LuxR family, sensor kinase FixL